MRLSCDTHFYDGKLDKDKLIIQGRLDRAAAITYELKLEAFAALTEQLSRYPSFDANARKYLKDIISTFQTSRRSKGPNYDPSNDLYADDLLYICYEVIQASSSEGDTAAIINETLSEISRGPCSQGKTHRLLGIVNALI